MDPQRAPRPRPPSLSIGTLAAAAIGCNLLVGATPGERAAPPASDAEVVQAVVEPRGPVPVPSPGARIEDERNTISVFETAGPATVFVTQTQLVRDRFTLRALEVPAGSGTGFVWDAAGHIVTNYHVVDGGRRYKVTLHDQRTFDAVLVGGEPRKDVAVLKLVDPPTDLTPILLPPRGQPLQVGQKALAIGNPFGLDHTLTTGVISALGREVAGYGGVTIRDMIQTDASINPGNSGGPLLDSAGQLIGMNTMIFSQSGQSAGIGFAVPESTIRRLVPQLVEHGKVTQVGIGIQFASDEVARRNRIRGVVVQTVLPESPAEAAGMKGLTPGPRGWMLGDVIVGVDDEAIDNFDDLYNALDGREPGERVDVVVLRGGDKVTLPIALTVIE